MMGVAYDSNQKFVDGQIVFAEHMNNLNEGIFQAHNKISVLSQSLADLLNTIDAKVVAAIDAKDIEGIISDTITEALKDIKPPSSDNPSSGTITDEEINQAVNQAITSADIPSIVNTAVTAANIPNAVSQQATAAINTAFEETDVSTLIQSALNTIAHEKVSTQYTTADFITLVESSVSSNVASKLDTNKLKEYAETSITDIAKNELDKIKIPDFVQETVEGIVIPAIDINTIPDLVKEAVKTTVSDNIDISGGASIDSDTLAQLVANEVSDQIESLTGIDMKDFPKREEVYTQTQVKALLAELEAKLVQGTVVHVRDIQLIPGTLTLEPGESYLLKTVTTPAIVTNPYVMYESSDSDIATVAEDGCVTAHKEGVVIIAARSYDGGYVSSCTVTVVNERTSSYTGFQLDKTEITLPVDGTDHLTLTAQLKDGQTVAVATLGDETINGSALDTDCRLVGSLTWSIEDEKATIDEDDETPEILDDSRVRIITISNGHIIALTPGTAKIVLMVDGTFMLECHVTVENQ